MTYSFCLWWMEIKIPFFIHGLDINLCFFREARLIGAYLLRQLLKADTNYSKHKPIWSKESSSFVLKNAVIIAYKSILNQLHLNWPVSSSNNFVITVAVMIFQLNFQISAVVFFYRKAGNRIVISSIT